MLDPSRRVLAYRALRLCGVLDDLSAFRCVARAAFDLAHEMTLRDPECSALSAFGTEDPELCEIADDLFDRRAEYLQLLAFHALGEPAMGRLYMADRETLWRLLYGLPAGDSVAWIQ